MFVGNPEHAVRVRILKAAAEIYLLLRGADYSDDPELSEAPFLFALVGIVEVVILGELPDDGWFAVHVITYLRALHFKEIMQRVVAWRLRKVLEAKISIGNDRLLVVHQRLVPAEDEILLFGPAPQCDMELDDLDVVAKDIFRRWRERSTWMLDEVCALLCEEIDLGGLGPLARVVHERKPVNISRAHEHLKGGVRGAKYVDVVRESAEGRNVAYAETCVFREQFEDLNPLGGQSE